ncbi:MAG: hypothetical protein N2747_06320 [Chitinophagaceae bacterium]|nr:hypothetical protein [Chitinophagaceae bacterium]
MKHFFTVALMLCTLQLAHTQTKWTILHNKKILLTASVENELENKIRIKRSELQKNEQLEVICVVSSPEERKYSIELTNENGQVLMERSGLKASFSNKEIRKLAKLKKSQIRINLRISPPNPLMMMPDRQIQLATLIFE